jgi:hypothetical protein
MPAATAALALALLNVTVSTDLWLNLDPSAQNTLTLVVPANILGGGVDTTTLVGGVHAIVTFNSADLFSPQGINADFTVDQIRIAGQSFNLFPVFPELGLVTGTLCVEANPVSGGGTGHLFIPVVGDPYVTADFDTDTFLTGPFGRAIPNGIPLSAHAQAPLQADLRTLFESDFQSGPVVVSTSAAGTVPQGVALFGGSPFSLNVTIENSFDAPQDPLLTDCDQFFASHPH